MVFPSGESGIFFTISILDDSALESVEEFTVIISSNQPNIVIPVESGTAVVTIFDTDRKAFINIPLALIRCYKYNALCSCGVAK